MMRLSSGSTVGFAVRIEVAASRTRIRCATIALVMKMHAMRPGLGALDLDRDFDSVFLLGELALPCVGRSTLSLQLRSRFKRFADAPAGSAVGAEVRRTRYRSGNKQECTRARHYQRHHDITLHRSSALVMRISSKQPTNASTGKQI